MKKKPNIIIVMSDQQRADLRRSCGYELDTMPFLDSLGQEGIDFTRAYTPNPTCLPARVSMFTGRYSEAHRARTNHNAKDAYFTEDLLGILKKNGYTTALCGKNHSHHALSDFDFCESNGHLGHEDETNTTPEQWAFADYMRDTHHMEMHEPTPFAVENQFPYRNISSAFKFIDGLEKDQPFFTWISFAEPHNPYQVPEPYFDMFPPQDLPPVHATKDDLAQKGARYEWLRGIWEQVLGDDIDNRILRARSNYHGMLRLIDDQVKRLVEGLKERGLEEDTVLLYLSDHGDFVGEYDLIRKGVDLPDILCHIPMVWWGGGVRKAGKISDAFVSIVDILPTICDMIGAELPFGVQGKSILPLLTGDDAPAKEYESAYSESGFSGLYWDDEDDFDAVKEGACPPEMNRFDCLNSFTQCGQVRSFWKGDYRVQVDMMGQGWLYDLKKDPFEKNNLWEDPHYLEVKADMLAGLNASMLRAVDPLPAPHWRYRVKTHPKGFWFDEDYHSGDTGVRE